MQHNDPIPDGAVGLAIARPAVLHGDSSRGAQPGSASQSSNAGRSSGFDLRVMDGFAETFERALEAERRFNRDIMDSIREGIVVYDRSLKIRAWNRVMSQSTLRAPEGVLGRSMYEIFPDLRALGLEAPMLKALDGVPSAPSGVLARMRGTCEMFAAAPVSNPVEDDRFAWHRIAFAPRRDLDGAVIGALVMIYDVTERKKDEDRLTASTDRYRRLARRLEMVREMERTAVARDIHDELGGMLTGVKMALSLSLNRLEKGMSSELEPLRRALDMTEQSLQSVRRIATGLRPPALDHLGLWAALEQYAGEFSTNTGIRTTLTVDPQLECAQPDPDCATSIFRIVQESLTNVARHAHASAVAIDLTLSDGEFAVEVKDNGVGIPPGRVNDARSWGIAGMQERARSCGGEVSVMARKEGGTCVRLQMPANCHHAD